MILILIIHNAQKLLPPPGQSPEFPDGDPNHPDYGDWESDYGDWWPGPFVGMGFAAGTMIPSSGPGSSWSQSSFGLPFGGRIVSAVPCLCSGTWEVTVTPPGLPGTFTYANMSQFDNHRLPFPGNWVIGVYSPQQACVQYAGFSCSIKPNQGVITPVVGTSSF